MKGKSVLYITNIQVPYRVKFFNELAKYCDLTVLYERSKSGNRDSKWTSSVECNYQQFFLDGFKIGNESSFSLKILKYICDKKYDMIIVGCYSTPVQIFANMVMGIMGRKFVMNFDGEVFANDNSLKTKIKKIVIKGAHSYLIAGEMAAKNLQKIVKDKEVVPYYFSSLAQKDLEENNRPIEKREDYILVVGQYFDYKGLDVAVELAKKMPQEKIVFVGMGNRTDLFKSECQTDKLPNVEVYPFLQKEELFKTYRECKCLLLPTRQECWGLVINEAASLGTPIVSTYGSGAAVEFLSERYPQLLAKPGDAESLIASVIQLEEVDKDEFSNYLKEKSKKYSIEEGVKRHLTLMEG